jgi:hypothetical protein
MLKSEKRVFHRNYRDKQRCATVYGLALIVSFLVALWTQSNINYWLNYFESQQQIPLWAAWIITILLNTISIIINLVSEILEFVF